MPCFLVLPSSLSENVKPNKSLILVKHTAVLPSFDKVSTFSELDSTITNNPSNWLRGFAQALPAPLAESDESDA